MLGLIDKSLFNELDDDYEELVQKSDDGLCPRCSELLVYVNEVDEERCNKCGLARAGGGQAGISKSAISGCIRVSNGTKVRVYGINTGDNSRAQHKTVTDLLSQIDASFNGPKIPKEILAATANVYSEIQRCNKERPFVKRGSIRREVLAAIMFFKCIEMGSPRRKRDIAIYMQLKTYGFCRGEQIIRNLVSDKVISLNMDIDISYGFTSRYLAMLGIDKKYEKFVTDFIERTEELNVGTSSQMSSKIAGAVWILVKGIGLKLSRDDVEKATGGCKQNTYMKYCNSVSVAAKDLEDIFIAHEVQMNFGGSK